MKAANSRHTAILISLHLTPDLLQSARGLCLKIAIIIKMQSTNVPSVLGCVAQKQCRVSWEVQYLRPGNCREAEKLL